MMGRLTLLPALAFFAASSSAQADDFRLHAFHKEKFGGRLECNLCHVPAKAGSVMLKRPGHNQCRVCHSADFAARPVREIFCGQCHASPSPGAADLLSFPRFREAGTILSGFSHAKHMDPKARTDSRTGFRADCAFCHKFDSGGALAAMPTHEQCAGCHSKPDMKIRLTSALRPEGCPGCHMPDEIELSKAAQHAASMYSGILFSHAAHFRPAGQFNRNCATCHSDIPRSAGVRTLALPKMVDCVQCHDSPRAVPAEYRMTNCRTCHVDISANLPIPDTHARNVKPASHTEVFRRHHEARAAEADAKCFACHQNVAPSAQVKIQCDSCHQAMRPASHTARWKDDLHGKYAALDRTVCATCHTAAYCSDCHNELPRSHQPVPLFKAGAHAFTARLNLRACLTCHTFQNTCAECHVKQFASLR